MLGYEATLLTDPDYSKDDQNKRRAEVLHLTRGWPKEWLFTDFPEDVDWSFVMLDREALGAVKRLRSRRNMSDRYRSLADAADAINRGEVLPRVDISLVRQMARALEDKTTMPPPILLEDAVTGTRVLVEGHSRGMAYMVANPEKIEWPISVIIGRSTHASNWAYF